MKRGCTLHFISLVFFVMSCTTTEEKVENIETKDIKSKGNVEGKSIGINADGQAVIHSEERADDELRYQQWTNGKLENDLAFEHLELKRCRQDLADPRLGGDGTVTEIPEIDNMKPASEVKEKFGLNEDGDLKFVKRESYLKRLKLERDYEQSLRKMLSLVSRTRSDCETKMSVARVKSGLPAKRFQGEGHFENGKWRQTQTPEKNLDDAFDKAKSHKANEP